MTEPDKRFHNPAPANFLGSVSALVSLVSRWFSCWMPGTPAGVGRAGRSMVAVSKSAMLDACSTVLAIGF